jgi:hypothetical protein
VRFNAWHNTYVQAKQEVEAVDGVVRHPSNPTVAGSIPAGRALTRHYVLVHAFLILVVTRGLVPGILGALTPRAFTTGHPPRFPALSVDEVAYELKHPWGVPPAPALRSKANLANRRRCASSLLWTAPATSQQPLVGVSSRSRVRLTRHRGTRRQSAHHIPHADRFRDDQNLEHAGPANGSLVRKPRR